MCQNKNTCCDFLLRTEKSLHVSLKMINYEWKIGSKDGWGEVVLYLRYTSKYYLTNYYSHIVDCCYSYCNHPLPPNKGLRVHDRIQRFDSPEHIILEGKICFEKKMTKHYTG